MNLSLLNKLSLHFSFSSSSPLFINIQFAVCIMYYSRIFVRTKSGIDGKKDEKKKKFLVP